MSKNETCGWNTTDHLDFDLDREYDCTADPGHDGFCPVHSPVAEVKTERLEDLLTSDRPLVGLKIQELDLSGAAIDVTEDRPLDLSGASIRRLKLDKTTFPTRLVLRHADVDTITAKNARFERGIDCSEMTCEEFRLTEATVDGTLTLEGGDIENGIRLDGANIGRVDGDGLTVNGPFSMKYTSVRDRMSLEHVEFERQAYFEAASFGGEVSILEAEFSESIEFRRANFDSRVRFGGVEINDDVTFTGAEFGARRAIFSDMDVSGDAIFTRVSSTSRLIFGPRKDTGRGPATVRERLSFEESDLRHLDLEGVDAGTLSLDEATLETLAAENLTIRGPLGASDVQVRREADLKGGSDEGLRLNGSRFHGTVTIEERIVGGELNVRESVFHSGVNFEAGDVKERAAFDQSQFNDTVSFSGRRFAERTTFRGTEFADIVKFDQTIFEAPISFARRAGTEPIPAAEFGSNAVFRDADFNKVDFTGCTFHGAAIFDEASFDSPPPTDESPREEKLRPWGKPRRGVSETPLREEERASRRDVTETRRELDGPNPDPDSSSTKTSRSTQHRPELQIEYDQPSDDPDGTREESDSGGGTNTDGDSRATTTQVDRESSVANLQDSTINGHVSIKNIEFDDAILFDRADLSSIALKGGNWSDSTVVSFRAADIDSGTIDVEDSSGTALEFNFTEAHVGDVNLLPSDKQGSVFTYCRIQRTIFDGFNFLPHTAGLRRLRWRIHTIDTDATGNGLLQRWWNSKKDWIRSYYRIFSGNGSADSFNRKRTTYQYAKNGASLVGQNEPASEFFKKEMMSRELELICECREERRFGTLLRYLALLGFGRASKYGESGIRVGIVSLIVVVMYMIGYITLGSSVEEGLRLSFGAFASLLVGNVNQTVDPTTAALASTEGFVGALLTALLLFTLTRSVHR